MELGRSSKLIAALSTAALVLSLGLAGCSGQTGQDGAGNGDTSSEAEAPSPSESIVEEDSSSVEFDDLVIYEDDRVTIRLDRFYEQEENYIDGPVVQKYMTVTITNNSDHEIDIRFNDPYLGDEGIIMANSSFLGPKPGKSRSYDIPVAKDWDPVTALDSLDDLYEIEFTLETLLEEESTGYYVDAREVDIYFSEVVSKP